MSHASGKEPFGFTNVLAELRISSPFVGPKELERRRGRPYKARLGANECLFGVSPAALDALRTHRGELGLYSDPFHAELREAIAETWRLPVGHIVVGEGIEGLLGLLVRAFIDPGDAAVTSRGAYPSFDYYVRGCGGRLARPRYLESGANDLGALVDAARRERAKLVYLANPDNPTGSQAAPAELRRLLDQLPVGCLLLLDEAYADFADAKEVLPTRETRRNLVRLRTFSKLYALAGARVGYAVADPDLLGPLESIRQHFAVSGLSEALALAALGDRAFVDRVMEETDRGRRDYCALAKRVGVGVLRSAANFVAFDFGQASRAERVADWLESHDVFVRRPTDPPLDRLIRITVAPAVERAYLAEALEGAMDAVSAREEP